MLGFTLCASLLSLASATVLVRLSSVSEEAATKHTLRVCNAYPSSHDLRVLKNTKELKGKSQMKYKQCIELDGPLKEGDRLNFEAGSVPLGTFTISDLPETKSTLLLVAFRESKVSTKIAFRSHTFEGQSAQLAVIDTFQGKAKSELSISQFQEPNKAGAALAVQEKALDFNTAMELDGGVYQVKIASGATRQVAGPFVVAKGEHYVLLRTGLDDAAPPPPSFLQETQKSGAEQEQHGDTTGTTGSNLFSNSANVNLMAEHADAKDSVRLLASPVVEPAKTLAAERASGTSGPGIPITIFPETQVPPATGGLTEGAERGESLGQFLGLVSEPVYPQEFVVYPLLKPVSTKEIASEDKEQERSGASAVGPTAAMLAVAVLSALFA